MENAAQEWCVLLNRGRVELNGVSEGIGHSWQWNHNNKRLGQIYAFQEIYGNCHLLSSSALKVQPALPPERERERDPSYALRGGEDGVPSRPITNRLCYYYHFGSANTTLSLRNYSPPPQLRRKRRRRRRRTGVKHFRAAPPHYVLVPCIYNCHLSVVGFTFIDHPQKVPATRSLTPEWKSITNFA